MASGFSLNAGAAEFVMPDYGDDSAAAGAGGGSGGGGGGHYEGGGYYAGGVGSGYHGGGGAGGELQYYPQYAAAGPGAAFGHPSHPQWAPAPEAGGGGADEFVDDDDVLQMRLEMYLDDVRADLLSNGALPPCCACEFAAVTRWLHVDRRARGISALLLLRSACSCR